ncbi:MAG TPA: OmpA family protein [Candidatus Xenobia bacterium]|nr:OmpA family protein [Candidatus Xenobia bacterium]
MRLWGAVALAVSMAMGLAAQAPSRAPAASVQAVEVPGGTILSYRAKGSTSVELRGTERAQGASAVVKVEHRGGVIEIELRRGAVSGLGPASRFGADMLTYVLWVVPLDGGAASLGEITFEGDRSDSLKVTTSHPAFWLLVTAEPDFAVAEPSPVAVLVSQSSELATAVPGPLLYFTRYTDYNASAAATPATAPLDLLQARKAVELAARVQPSAAGSETAPDDARAGDAFRLAQAYLEQAEREFAGEGDNLTQYARTAVQLAESARALATGAAGRLPAHEAERLRARVKAAETELATLRDRSSQIEASLDQERHHTRELESEVLSLRERITSLETAAERARTNSARLEEQLAYACTELRLQLASMGHLTEQGGAVMIDLASDVLYDSGRYELRASAREGLGRLAALRRLFFPRAALRFEGHTDLVGEEEYNQWLSEQRALSVFRYFLEDAITRTADDNAKVELDTELSVAEQLLKMNYNAARRQASQRQELLTLLGNRVVGKGMREPLVPEKGPNEQNRRVTIILAPREPGAPVSFCPMGEGQ